MTSTEPSAPSTGVDRTVSAIGSGTAATAETLERFWPSRRGHSFDELCR